MRRVILFSLSLLLAACVRRTAPPQQFVVTPAAPKVSSAPATIPPSRETPNAAGLPIAIASFADLPGWSTDQNARSELEAFAAACPTLLRHTDTSGLTQPGDYAAACAAVEAERARTYAAPALAADAARHIFEAELLPARIADGQGLITGYFELTLRGSRTRDAFATIPLYGLPPDLIDVDLGLFSPSLLAKHIRGRVDGHRLVPYWDRAAIEDGALPPNAPVVAWAADPVEAFFLAIQGSGRVALPDGTELRVGYAGQNGRDYTGIGRLLRERGQLAPGHATMEDIVAWVHAHPEEGRALMRENKSYVFFKPLTGPGPLGALGVPLTPEVSAAADPSYVPLGAPVYVTSQTVDGPLARIIVTADTGGAIKGPNRFDWFTGSGQHARRLASGQSTRSRAWLLLPRAAADHLRALPR